MSARRVPRALTIAGSDSGGGAGIQADLQTFAAYGVHGACVVTALTAQNTRGVVGVLGVSPRFVRAQLDAVLDDLGADAVKLGMLHDAPTIAAVAAGLVAHRVRRVVVDPVMVAKGGARLLEAAAVTAFRARILPLADVVTPNLAEAAALAGFCVDDVASMEAAARRIAEAGARAVVVKGGHLRGDAVDVVLVRGRVRTLRATRIGRMPPHGTGCTFAAAIAAGLARGAPLEHAIRAAKRYVTRCIRHAYRVGGGHPVLLHPPTRPFR